MKLRSQLTFAFTSLLLVVLAVTGYLIYSLILDILIQDEKRQLEETGELLVSLLSDQYGSANDIEQFNLLLQEQELHLFIYDRSQDTVLFSTMPNVVVAGFLYENNFANRGEHMWQLGKDHYVNSRIIISPEVGRELILLTPMTDLHAIQQNFFSRLFVIFLVGAFVAVWLSYFLTKKLITPLSMLQLQLKKIEKRQFDDIERVVASGEIKEVEQSVFEMATELERYMKSQRIFFQNASHELKTPLMTIQGYAEGIKDDIFQEEDKEKGLEIMVEEVKRLKVIINEMILLAKLDTEKEYKPEQIEGAAFLDSVVDRVIPLLNENDVKLEKKVDENIYLYADQEKLLRAFSNVVVNAIRHANNRVFITAYREHKEIIVTIEDDGDGIKEDLIPYIFHRFVKGSGGETGLGLAIARTIVEQTNGKISVDSSTTLGGARFTLRFPSATHK